MFKKIKYFFFSLIALFLSFFIERNDKYIAFGSWEGRLYLDNSKYMLEYIHATYGNEYQLFWVGEDSLRTQLPSYVIFVKKDSFSSILPLLRCKYIFFSQMHNGDISSFNVFRKAIMVFLNHGICLKKCFTDAAGYDGKLEIENLPLIRRVYGTIVGTYQKYDFFVAASEYHFNTYLTSCAYLGANSNNVLKTGTPRNDSLANCTIATATLHKEKYAKLIGFDKNAKVVMYLPTFRRKKAAVCSLVAGDTEQQSILNEILKKYNAVLIEKNHYAANKFAENHNKTDDFSRLIKLDVDVDLQEMLQFTDVQISDYSGAFMDFLHMDKPIIHYLYDYEYYRDHDSGLYLEKEDFASGNISENFEELCENLEKALCGNDDTDILRKRGKELFVGFEDGNSCKKIFDLITSEQ